MRNEIILGYRFSKEQLKDTYTCCKGDLFEELLIYHDLIGRDLAYIFAKVI